MGSTFLLYIIIIACIAWLIISYRSALAAVSERRLELLKVLRDISESSARVGSCNDAATARLILCEARAKLDTLAELHGGLDTLAKVSGVNASKLSHTLAYQDEMVNRQHEEEL